jgi:hypothetical protein
MPARACIAAAIALVALAAPCAALAQGGGGTANPAAGQQSATPQPTPDHQAPAPAATQPAAAGHTADEGRPDTPAQTRPPDGGFDVLPVAAGALALLLAGLLLWRRPHVHR